MRRKTDNIISHIIEHIEEGNYEMALSMLKGIVAEDSKAMQRKIEESNNGKDI